MLAREYIPRYTVEDYKQWEGDWELIEGIPFAMAPSPFGKHQKIVGRIVQQILNYADECKDTQLNTYVELDWIVNEETVVRPDVSVLCKEVPEHIKTPPKAVFEVVSKSTAIKDEKIKFELYEREGVDYYILVYPDIQKVRGFKLQNKKYEKFFDGDEGTLEIDTCHCKIKIDIKKIFS
ncbi:MAG: Uma2 family endonuclease [Aquificae bacterium]|nr:Uma2 family endonuclease [Aquificota bacterium]